MLCYAFKLAKCPFVSSIHTCFFFGAAPVLIFWHHNVWNGPSLTCLLSMGVMLAFLETLKGTLPKGETAPPSCHCAAWNVALERQHIAAILNALQFKSNTNHTIFDSRRWNSSKPGTGQYKGNHILLFLQADADLGTPTLSGLLFLPVKIYSLALGWVLFEKRVGGGRDLQCSTGFEITWRSALVFIPSLILC